MDLLRGLFTLCDISFLRTNRQKNRQTNAIVLLAVTHFKNIIKINLTSETTKQKSDTKKTEKKT